MRFRFVQRLNRDVLHEGPITKPEDFRADYMGSAEFEFGAISKAYKTMRAQKLAQTTVKVNAFNIQSTFHVVMPAEHARSIQASFQAWFDGGLRGQEDPRLDRVISKRGFRGELM